MIFRNYFNAVILTIFAISCVSCQDVLIEGTVVSVDSYGGLQPSFSPKQIRDAGVEYGDLLLVSIGDDIEVVAPYVDAYTEAGCMSPCLCNYNDADETFTMSMSNGSFANHAGGKEGDNIVVRMKQKGGYRSEYELLKGTYTYERSDYQTDEVFANFRVIATSGITPEVLYRSTSPINTKHNRVRYEYTDSLCEKYGIRTIIDIADSDEKVEKYIGSSDYSGKYMQKCLASGNIVGLGSNADFLDDVFMEKLSRGLRGIISHPAPYLIHCNEGKDRTGFYCMLVEALCGATVEEMKTDYMQTFENMYHHVRGSEQYELTWRKNGLRMLYLVAYPEEWERLLQIDWDNISVDGVDLSQAAQNYIMKAGLSADEVEALKAACQCAPAGK